MEQDFAELDSFIPSYTEAAPQRNVEKQDAAPIGLPTDLFDFGTQAAPKPEPDVA